MSILTNTKYGINLFIFYFVEYTSARSPHEYCNNIGSPPEKIISLNENRIWEEIENPNFVQPSPSFQQETNFQSNSNNQFAFSSGIKKPMRDFDLNRTPPSEDE